MERRHAVLVAAGFLAVLGVVLWVWLGKTDARFATESSGKTETPPAGSAPPSAQPRDLLTRISDMLATIRRGGMAGSDLEMLRRALAQNPDAGISAIRQFLATGEDAATGQAFTVGARGTLEGAPTLRVFLLDQLGQLAGSQRSRAGAEVAREILAKKESPDEWAIALRNVAWDDPQSRPFLAEKMREMFAYEPWTSTPTSGLLEAFDVAVYSGDARFIPTLRGFAQGENEPLQRAATVALDRLAENSPLNVMTFLNANPTTIAELPFVRADYFAKADLGDAAQRKAVEVYLDRADVGAPEKIKFLHAVASPGSFISESLLETSRPAGEGVNRGARIAPVAAEWARANRFPALQPHVLWLLERATDPDL